jgi:hypothetical protein
MEQAVSQRLNGIAVADDWKAASRALREARAEKLTLPSGAVILAAKPEPLDWILSGRVPQRLLAAALEKDGAAPPAESEVSGEDVLELARFACELVRASVVRPAIGDGAGEICFEEIPVEDRAFIFQWACRALDAPGSDGDSGKESLSSPPAGGLERFRAR